MGLTPPRVSSYPADAESNIYSTLMFCTDLGRQTESLPLKSQTLVGNSQGPSKTHSIFAILPANLKLTDRPLLWIPHKKASYLNKYYQPKI